MPIDIEKESAASGCALTKLRTWPHLGHEVALIRFEKQDADPPYADVHLVCECDFAYEDVIEDGKVVGKTHPNDPHGCPSKKAVMAAVRKEMKPSCMAVLRREGLKAAILDVHRRVKSGEYFGQGRAYAIYAQEVAELLDTDMPAMHEALAELFAEEKLDLNGMILMDYVPRFRFPKEIQYVFRMMVESPLGWPNGEAGACFLETIEGAIHEHTDYKHGKDAFWPHNYPNVAASHLVEFGYAWLAIAMSRADTDRKDREDLRFTDCGSLAKRLEDLAARFRALGKAHGYPLDPFAGGRKPGKKAPRRRKPQPRKKSR
ncbi:MAG: hypothetical protein RL272_544 [Candidatus Parcubacteria bacterium]|jgi:hypothetical protein